MGWNGITLNGKNPKNIIKDEIERDKRFEVKYLSKKGKVIYTAIKNKDTEKIFASVFLLDIDKERNELYYKEVVEEAWPFVYEAPEKLIKLLSQTDDEDALEWRKKCLYKPKKGDKIKFKIPITFVNGDVLSEFVFKGYSTFQNGFTEYNISNWRNLEFEIIK